MAYFRIETTFNYNPDILSKYIKENDKRLIWDEGYEYLREVRAYEMNTHLINVKVKN
jgi:hypothetical protein